MCKQFDFHNGAIVIIIFSVLFPIAPLLCIILRVAWVLSTRSFLISNTFLQNGTRSFFKQKMNCGNNHENNNEHV